MKTVHYAASFTLYATALVGTAFAAPNPWGSFLDWPSECRPCIDSAYEACGGGVASINEMVECVCTGSSDEILGECRDSTCPGQEVSDLEDMRVSYCTKYTTTGSWTLEPTASPTTREDNGDSDVTTTTTETGMPTETDGASRQYVTYGTMIALVCSVVLLT